VGLPRDGDPRASYALIEDGVVHLRRIAYPVEETVRRVEASGLPPRARRMMVDCLRRGRLENGAAAAVERAG
jgi:hypothetical protein